MKKHIIQFVANTKKNLFVFLALPFLWTSCRNNTEITESISPNAETAPRSALVTADKASGIKLFSFMEVNDTNPLNNLNFTLKKSGKPLVDMVVLFSANINYDAVNDKVIVSNNPNVQHLLTNKAKYLKPLRDKGMKVILGILGNHDRSGVANLSTQRAKQFAQELKKTCELYDLDGVFFDDEYSAYENPPPAGFVTPSNNAAARLAYETKQAMPNKLVTVYVYSRTASFPNPVDGVQAGKFVDYAIYDYGGTWDLSSNYPGLPKSGMAMASQEFNRDYYATAQSLRNLRTSGYGAHMIFAMDPNRSNFTTKQLPAMKLIAKELYDDELVYTNTPYRKDW